MSNNSSWQERKQQAFQLALQKRTREALALCQSLCDEKPGDAELVRALAVLYAQSGDKAKAEVYARKLVQLQPGNATSYLTLANMLKGEGKLREAEAHLRSALSIDSEQAQAWLGLGEILRIRQAVGESRACFEKVVALDPKNVSALHNLGVLFQSEGNLEEALGCYRKAVEAQPSDARLLHSLGSALYVNQSWGDAAACFRQVIQLQPNNTEALLNLANVNFDAGEYARAAVRYQQLLASEPGCSEARLGLGMSYYELGKPTEALECYRELIVAEPYERDHYIRLGGLCLECGRHDEALNVYRKAQECMPDDSQWLFHQGIALQHLGRLNEALKLFTSLKDIDEVDGGPDVSVMAAGIYERLGDYRQCWEIINDRLNSDAVSSRLIVTALKVCHQVDEVERVVGLAERMLDNDSFSSCDRRGVYFALGALQDKLKNYDSAFAAYSRGNALRKVSYSESKDSEFLERLTRVFGSEVYRNLEPTRDKGGVPVFIVGMPRSGTSLIEQILNAHSNVSGAGESLALGRLVERLGGFTGSKTDYPEVMDSIDTGTLEMVADRYLECLRDDAPEAAFRITDKMPHNFAYLGLIYRMFPEARIIHCSRDPLDTCLSCYFQDFSGFHNYAYDLGSLAAHYRQYEKIMEFWRTAVKVPMLEIAYEDLIEEPEARVKELLDYCDLNWEGDCLRFHESDRNVRTASYDQVRKPLYRTSAGRWRNYERHIGPLLEAFGDNSCTTGAGQGK